MTMFNPFYYWLVIPFVITQSSYSKYTRYILRFLLDWNNNLNWVKYLNSDPQIIQWRSEHEADFYLKFHNAYLSNSFDNNQKLLSLTNHYDWLFSKVNTELCENKALPLLQYQIEGENPQLLTLNLHFKGKHRREGESCILLELDGQVQYALSFSYIILNGEPTFFIGGLQAGKQDKINLDTIKHLTKSLYGLRPKQLLLHSLSTLCEFYEVKHIVGVSNQNHFYQHSRKKRDQNRVKTNLDEFWLEFGGSLDPSGNYVFNPLSSQIDLSEIASKKRSQYRKRQLILDALTEQGNQQLEMVKKIS
ncbi:DUF535 domain-containing protein [Acinetobacter wuhouensis]|uniref:DUF535 domain-containing protein n=2 Tax=Acinetobacter wuhouensis TaxID=1879050 RepID=A0A4Q7AHP7_9GAMM|nr:DUF535 domain-containing protein [Acinetobacter wuhouensis]